MNRAVFYGFGTNSGGVSWTQLCKPLNLTISNITGGKRLTWEANPQCTGVDGFSIYVNDNSAGWALLGTVRSTTLSYDDLTQYMVGHIVSYRVVSGIGWTYSDFSDASTPITEPDIPTILQDGNTIGFWDWGKVSSFTLDGTNVTSWADKLGGAVTLSEATNKPVKTNDGVLFQGKSLTTGTITYGTTTSWYLVVRVNSVSAGAPKIIQGVQGYQASLGQVPSTQVIRIFPATVTDIPVTYGAWYVLEQKIAGGYGNQTVRLDGVDKRNADTFNSVAPNGIIIGAVSCNFEVKGIIARKIADTNTNMGIIRAYLQDLYNLV